MKNTIRNLQQKVGVKAVMAMSKFKKDQRGELPYWVNALMVIVITVVLGSAVYSVLSPTIKTNITNYVSKIFSNIV